MKEHKIVPQRVVILHRLAAREARQAERYYRKSSLMIAQRFRQAVTEVIERIGRAAEQGSPYLQHLRWMQLRRFPYLLFYEIRDPLPVMVYAIAHTSRRPGYWRGRRTP